MRLVFMGTPAFAVPSLLALLDSAHDVAAVYCQPPRPAQRGQKERASPVQECAEARGVPVHTSASLRDAEVQAAFFAHRAEAVVVAAYGLILPQAILDACPERFLNVHPSALPRWRGAAPIQRTILAGDAATELCIMQMEAGLDTGPVLRRLPYPVPPLTTAGELHDRLAQAAGPLLLDALGGDFAATPQAEDGVTYAAKIDKEEARIDWAQPAISVQRQVLGLSPFPGAWFAHRGERFKLLRAEAIPGEGEAGVVQQDGHAVACGSGLLRLIEIQRQGKQPMPVETLLRGYPLPFGTRLG